MSGEQEQLFYEDIYDALKAMTVRIAGVQKGAAKIVGSRLWTHIPPDKAGEKLNRCLSRDHVEKLDLEEFQWFLKEARKVNCHIGINQLCGDAGYATPQPIEPEDEKAALQRQAIQAVEALMPVLNRFMKVSGMGK